MKPDDVACAHFGCDAQPGEPCTWEGVPRSVDGPPPLFHAERLELAERLTTFDAGAVAEKAAWDKAVVETGLVV